MFVPAWLKKAGLFSRHTLTRPQTPPRRFSRLDVETLETRIVPTLAGNQLFPADNPWNHPITDAPVAATSDAMIAAIYGSLIPLHADFGTVYQGALNGIPYNIVSGSQPKVQVIVDAYAAESDVLPIPIPAGVVLEGDTPTGPSLNNTSDRHLIVYDQDNNIVYETFGTYRPGETRPNGQVDPNFWHAASEAVWDLNHNTYRTAGFTSADAAGLPILPGLVRPDEVFNQGEIDHALRFTVHLSSNAYVFPASHHTYLDDPTDTLHPRMGEHFRLKSSVDITKLPGYGVAGYQQDVVILQALQKYGMIVADNGSTGFLSGAPSPLWNDEILHWLAYVPMSDFEVVDLTPVVSGIDINTGPAGTAVTIQGLNFAGTGGTLQVFFGTTPAASVTVLSDSQIIAVAPPGTGTVNVTVVSGYGTSMAGVPFAYSHSTVVTLTAANAAYTGNPYAGAGATATGVGNATVSGTFTYTYYVGAAVNGAGSNIPPTNVGTYTVTAHFTSADPGYLDADSTPVTFAITPVAITITANAQGKTFGDGDPALTCQISAGSLLGSDTLTGSLSRAAGENVGTYAIQQGTLTAGGNYGITYVGANLVINPRQIGVIADNQTKVYGYADPVLTYHISAGSLAFNDAFSGALGRAAGENVGSYAIGQGTLALSSNYSLGYAGATLVIQPRAIVVTADAKTKVYGTVDPVLTYRITSGSLVGSDQMSGVLTRVTGENVGSYAIKQGTLTAGSNYQLTFVGASWTITPVQTIVVLTSSAPNATSNQSITFTVTVSAVTGSGIPTGKIQFKDGNKVLATVTLVNGKASFTTKLTQGSHTITAVYLADPNFLPPLTPTTLIEQVTKGH